MKSLICGLNNDIHFLLMNIFIADISSIYLCYYQPICEYALGFFKEDTYIEKDHNHQ